MENNTPPKVSRTLILTQFLLGLGTHVFFTLPYSRRIHGLKRLDPRQRYLFVANHVSLLDTILMGAIFWRSGCYPILVLGDKHIWHASRFKRLLSSKIGFFLDRGKINPDRINELQLFGRASRDFHLVVYPEGTRGDGVRVNRCQPGLYYIAQEARVPIVPVFIENMQFVSTKTGPFHPFGGLRKVEVHFGEPIPSTSYLSMSREDFSEFVRRQIETLRPTQSAEYSSPVPSRA